MIKIVKMCPDHVAAVAELEKTCFSMPWSENAVRGELTNPLSLWLVALQDDCVVGYIGSQTVLQEADMMNLAVDPANRKMGIGEKLVKALIAQLQKEQTHCITLEVRASNTAACRLYEKLGFQQVGRRPGYYQNPKEDALILRMEWDV